MKPETDNISDEEWLLRRIHRQFFLMDGSGVDGSAFRPRTSGRDPDVNGISLYRMDCLADPQDILAQVPVERRNDLGIVKISVQLIRSLGLTVLSDPDPLIAGHVVIAEMNVAGVSRHAGRAPETMKIVSCG